MRTSSALAFAARSDEPPLQRKRLEPRRRLDDIADLVDATTHALRAAADDPMSLEDVARFCTEVGGVDPRLERAALLHAHALIDRDALVADLADSLRARLLAAGALLPTLIARGGLPRVLASLGLEDVDPPDAAIQRALQPRIARFYWQRLRAYVAWAAACAV
jgi:hypothetical protein